MYIKNKISQVRKILYGIMLLAVFLSAMGGGRLSSVSAQGAAALPPTLTITTENILSDGQFVYGPNVGDFNLKTYFGNNAPHLLKYADDLYGHSKYFSINPKIYLTLLEIHSHLISTPDAALMEDPFGLSNGDFISQIEYISNKMSDAYYLHLYSYSPRPVSQRTLKPFFTPGGVTINVTPNTNAGTYAIIAGLAAMDEQNISLVLDNSQPDGFYQTYTRLFENDDPLDQTNHIYIPGEVGAVAAPDNLLQFPWLQGQSWFFSGVHSNGSGGSGTPFTNAAALDFSPGGISWGSDTSNMWVAASAFGIPTKTSNCGFSILHSDGWETGYYHIENIQNFSGTINQNDKIGVIANTLAEATCAGGNASGPHVHFWLSHNGALTAINGTPLSGWYVHAGRWEYDTDPNYMWLEKNGVKKYANINTVLSESTILTTFVDVPATYWAWNFIERLYSAGITNGCGTSPLIYCPNNTATRAEMAVFLLRSMHGSGYTPPAIGGSTGFSDVPITHWAAAWIKQLALEGITNGCGTGLYCPNATVTRAEMAVFLLRGKHSSGYTPPLVGTSTGFSDVPITHWAAAWIKQLAAEGITSGCGPSLYCPSATVTRAEMAAFLVRAFSLP
jgi:LasA protease